jgi:hypothetical protein
MLVWEQAQMVTHKSVRQHPIPALAELYTFMLTNNTLDEEYVPS